MGSHTDIYESEEIDNSDTQSINEVETEEEELKPKTKPKRKIISTDQKIIELKEEPKTKPKKPISEAKRQQLAKARKVAREKLKEKSAITQKIKDMKKEKWLLRKLELEAQLHKHNEVKKELLVAAGYINPANKKSSKKKKEQEQEQEQEEENEVIESESDDEVKQLEAKLNKLKMKNKKLAKTQKEILDYESEEEKEQSTRAKPKKPVMKKEPDVIDDKDRYRPNLSKKTNDSEINKQIRLLFPNF